MATNGSRTAQDRSSYISPKPKHDVFSTLDCRGVTSFQAAHLGFVTWQQAFTSDVTVYLDDETGEVSSIRLKLKVKQVR
jgi:hypothetical protein